MGWGNTKPSSSWFKLGFPSGYVADVLQVLEALAELGHARTSGWRPPTTGCWASRTPTAAGSTATRTTARPGWTSNARAPPPSGSPCGPARCCARRGRPTLPPRSAGLTELLSDSQRAILWSTGLASRRGRHRPRQRSCGANDGTGGVNPAGPPARGLRPHCGQARVPDRRLRDLHGARGRPRSGPVRAPLRAAQQLPDHRGDGRRLPRDHGRGPCWGRARPGPSRPGRGRRRAVRLLHAGVRRRPDLGAAVRRRSATGGGGQPLPVHRVHRDPPGVRRNGFRPPASPHRGAPAGVGPSGGLHPPPARSGAVRRPPPPLARRGNRRDPRAPSFHLTAPSADPATPGPRAVPHHPVPGRGRARLGGDGRPGAGQ